MPNNNQQVSAKKKETNSFKRNKIEHAKFALKNIL